VGSSTASSDESTSSYGTTATGVLPVPPSSSGSESTSDDWYGESTSSWGTTAAGVLPVPPSSSGSDSTSDDWYGESTSSIGTTATGVLPVPPSSSGGASASSKSKPDGYGERSSTIETTATGVLPIPGTSTSTDDLPIYTPPTYDDDVYPELPIETSSTGTTATGVLPIPGTSSAPTTLITASREYSSSESQPASTTSEYHYNAYNFDTSGGMQWKREEPKEQESVVRKFLAWLL
jgi:hypothetical protein